MHAADRRRWPVWAELDRSLDLNGNPPAPAQTALLIHPAVNLAEGDRYIVALRNLRGANDNVIQPQAPFAELLSGDSRPSAQERYYKHEILPQLRRAGISIAIAVPGVGLHGREPGEPHRLDHVLRENRANSCGRIASDGHAPPSCRLRGFDSLARRLHD